MNDNQTTVQQIKSLVDSFVKERDWDQFHDTKSICMNISVEANELMDIFLWAQPQEIEQILHTKLQAIEHELADVFFALLLFCNKHNIDLTSTITEKIKHNAEKYPVNKARGINKKYKDL